MSHVSYSQPLHKWHASSCHLIIKPKCQERSISRMCKTIQSRKTSFCGKSKSEDCFASKVNHEIRGTYGGRGSFMRNPSNNGKHFVSPANRGWRCYGGPPSVTSVRRPSVHTASSHWHCQVTIIIAVTGNRSKVEIFHHKQSPACKLSPDRLCQHSPM